MNPTTATHAGEPGKPLCAARGAYPMPVSQAGTEQRKEDERARRAYYKTLNALTIVAPSQFAHIPGEYQCTKCAEIIKRGLHK